MEVWKYVIRNVEAEANLVQRFSPGFFVDADFRRVWFLSISLRNFEVSLPLPGFYNLCIFGDQR